MTTRLREMTSDDAQAAAALCGELGYPATPDALRARIAALRGRPDHSLLVAEDSGGRVVGWVHVTRTEVLESEPWAEVAGLVVTASARGRGVGRLLMEAAERWAREHGLGLVRLRSNIVRTAAHEFYRRLGYEALKTQVNFRKPLV